MVIDQNKYVAISYTLKYDNAEGELIETIDASKPLEFVFGIGNLLPAFEKQLAGLTIGDSFAFEVPSSESYGEYNEDKVVELKTEMFATNGETPEGLLTVGNEIPMQDSQGNRMNGVVKSVTSEIVMMDFNHPLAGKTIFFDGKVETVRIATEEEINPPQHSCGCGSGEGGGGCSTEGGNDHGHDHGDGGCCGSGEGKGHGNGGGGCGCN